MWVPRDAVRRREEGGHSTLGRIRFSPYAQWAVDTRSAVEMPRPRARRRAAPARKIRQRTGRPVRDPANPVGVDTSPKGDIPTDVGSRSADIVAYLRTLQTSPPRDGTDQRNGRSSERSFRVPPPTNPSFVPTFTTVVLVGTNDGAGDRTSSNGVPCVARWTRVRH